MATPQNFFQYCKTAFHNVRMGTYAYNGICVANGDTAGTATTKTSESIGAVNGATVSAVERGNGIIHKTILTLTATPITITDDAGVAQYGGTGKIYDFPEGLIGICGAVTSGSVTLGTTGTIINTWTGVHSLGSVTASTGATLVSTEADIMRSNTISAATAKVGTIDGVSGATQVTDSAMLWYDGTATALDLYFNIAVADDVTHTSGTGTYTGVITVTWLYLGDN